MNVELAKTAGFCFGVKRAVDTVYKQIEKHQSEKIFTYGPIIHNEEVIKDLRSHGVEVLSDQKKMKWQSYCHVCTIVSVKLLCQWMCILSIPCEEQAYCKKKTYTGRNKKRSYRIARYGTQASCT